MSGLHVHVKKEDGDIEFVCDCPDAPAGESLCYKHEQEAEAIMNTMVQYFKDQETVKNRLKEMGYF